MIGDACMALQVDLDALVAELFPNQKFAPRTPEQLNAAVVRAAFLANPKRFENPVTSTLDDVIVNGLVIKHKARV